MKKYLQFYRKHEFKIDLALLLLDIAITLSFLIHRNLYLAALFAFLTGVECIMTFTKPILNTQEELIFIQKQFIEETLDELKKEIENTYGQTKQSDK